MRRVPEAALSEAPTAAADLLLVVVSEARLRGSSAWAAVWGIRLGGHVAKALLYVVPT